MQTWASSDRVPCLSSAESVLLDGANGICADARLGSREGVLGTVALTLLLAMLFGWLFARAKRLALAVASILVLGALPGSYAIWVERADRPLSSSPIAGEQLLRELEAFARAHGCGRVQKDECPNCAPILRLALAQADACSGGAAIVLGPTALDGSCSLHGDTLYCGAGNE